MTPVNLSSFICFSREVGISANSLHNNLIFSIFGSHLCFTKYSWKLNFPWSVCIIVCTGLSDIGRMLCLRPNWLDRFLVTSKTRSFHKNTIFISYNETRIIESKRFIWFDYYTSWNQSISSKHQTIINSNKYTEISILILGFCEITLLGILF